MDVYGNPRTPQKSRIQIISLSGVCATIGIVEKEDVTNCLGLGVLSRIFMNVRFSFK